MVQLYPDFRIGGKPRFILADEPPNLMLIPDEVRTCVVYIGYELPTGEMSFQGTAFFVGYPIEGTEKSLSYLVTAKHVIQGIESKSDSGEVLLRVNFKDGNAYTIKTELSKWVFHPEETELDVAVYPHPWLKGADLSLIPFGMFLNEKVREELEFGIGEEVFLTGLFYNHHGRKRNIPIVRIGNVVSLPEEKVRTRMGFIDAYLVESRSIGGLSGAPVFVSFGITRILKGRRKHFDNKYGSFYLLGLMHGHWDAELPDEVASTSEDAAAEARKKEVVNMGIAIVVPVEKILEVINQPMVREEAKKFEQEAREEVLPTMDSVGGETPAYSQQSFESALKTASRRTSAPVKEKKETSE